MRLEGYSGGGPFSDLKKECSICHGPLYTPEVTREILKEKFLVDPEDIYLTIQERKKEVQRKFLANYIKDHKDHYEDFLPKEESLE